ncbi:hypothetical protein [Parafilimonas sp.]|uniref:hypothetical protein n=1 Tax=Parafilimonas sp. TaxID=1969739 RepID=UPI0039E2BD27
MSKVISLFNMDEIEQLKKEQQAFTDKNDPGTVHAVMPLLYVPKKKASKNDSPLEKEMRRFNRLIKEIHEHEQSEKEEKRNEEKYERLFQQKVVPKMMECALLKLEMAQRMENVVAQAKLTKAQRRLYTEFMIAFLDEVAPYNETLMQILREKTNEQVRLLNKKDKTTLQNIMEGAGFNPESIASENFDLNDFFRSNEEKMKNTFAPGPAEKENVHTDIHALYKMLVKEIHPDTESDEELKQQKHHLMQQLVEAKNNNDLYAMLQLKAFMEQKSGDAFNNTEFYTLDKLKRLNKMLKKRVDANRASYTSQLFESLRMDNGFIFMDDPHKSAEARIKDETDEINDIIDTVKKDLEKPLTPEALLEILHYFKFADQ